MGFGIDFVLDGIEGFSSAVGNLQAAQGTIGNDFAHWMGDQAQDFGDWADAALPGPDVYGNIAFVTKSACSSIVRQHESITFRSQSRRR